MVGLLLNPNGRISRHRFWQGAVVLTVATVIIISAMFWVNGSFGLLVYPLIYCYVCVYGKRFHDAGQTAWWILLVWAGALVSFFILFTIVFVTILPNFFTAEQKGDLARVMELLERGDQSEADKGMRKIAEGIAPLIERAMIALLVVINGVSALILGALKTFPGENKHGAVPGTDAGDAF